MNTLVLLDLNERIQLGNTCGEGRISSDKPGPIPTGVAPALPRFLGSPLIMPTRPNSAW